MKFSLFFSNFSTATVVLCVVSLAIIFHTPATDAFVTSSRHSIPITYHHKNTMRFLTSKNEGGQNEQSDENSQSGLQQEKVERVTWNPLRLMVLKLGFTEPGWTSPLNYGKKDGVFSCAYCGLELFDSSGKYDSGSGWPSFWRSINDGHVGYKKEWDGRLECTCGRCDSHLGHVFLDGPLPSKVTKTLFETAPPSDPRGRQADGYLPRFCVNGASLTFQKREDATKY